MRAPGIKVAVLLAVAGVHAARPADAQPVVPGLQTSVYSTLPGPAGLTFDSAGNLFVGRDVGSPAITEQLVRRIPAGGGAATDYGPFGIADPLGVFFDAGGTLTGEAGSLVVSGPVTPTSGQLVAIPPSLSSPQPGAMLQVLHAGAPLVSPHHVAVAGDRLLIVDSAAKRIHEFTGGLLSPVPFFSSTTETPRFVAVGAGGVYVSFESGVIRRYDTTGAPVGLNPLASGLAGTLPIAVSPGDDFAAGLYVVEGGTGKLLRFADEGTRTDVGTLFPTGLGEIEFGPDGALYVAAFSSGQVFRIGEPLPPPPLGPFLCYNAKTTPGTPKPPKVEVGVVDAFETRVVRVSRSKGVCSPATVTVPGNPVPVENEGVASLASYSSRWTPAASHIPQTLGVTNALGTLALQTLPAGADRVLIPSGFSESAAPAALTNGGDSFQCYKARPAPGEVFARRDVNVVDSLGPGGAAGPGRALTLRKPKHLCLPGAVDGEPVGSPDDLLVCYAAKPAKGAARSTVLEAMHVGNALGPDQQLDMLRGATPTSVSSRSGRIAGDTIDTVADTGMTRPGEWDLDDSEGPRWSGGGTLAEGDLLQATFGADAEFEEGTVRRWRVFVEIDIAVNDTNAGPGVVMRSAGIPGIPDGTEVRAMAHGKPAGLRASSAFFTPPNGTTLTDLADAEQTFEANGDDTSGAFAFQIKSFGIEYQLSVTSGGSGTGVPEFELCLPSTTP